MHFVIDPLRVSTGRTVEPPEYVFQLIKSPGAKLKQYNIQPNSFFVKNKMVQIFKYEYLK